MSSPVVVVGHKNPDNDAICSAVGYAYLENELAKRDAEQGESVTEFKPVRLGPLPPETAWVLEKNGIEVPEIIRNVRARISDVMTKDLITANENATLLEAGRLLRLNDIRSLVVTDDDGFFKGILSTREIANRFTRATTEEGSNELDIAQDLVASLQQRIGDLIQTDVLVFDPDDFLKESVEELSDRSLREGIVLDEEGHAIGIVTRTDVSVWPKRKVVLVDHNEVRQAVNGIEDAEVITIIDHHRIADVTTADPIKFINLPVGATSTIVTMEYKRLGVDMPPEIASVLLSAIMTDTVILKSPTTTSYDRDIVEELGKTAGVDPVEFGLEVFRARGGETDMPVDQLVEHDSKEFQLGDTTVFIAQHETVDLPLVMEREEEIREYLRSLVDSRGYDFALIMITDIMKEGSQFLCEGNTRIVDRTFGIDSSAPGGAWMPGVLSRKKQVAAKLLA